MQCDFGLKRSKLYPRQGDFCKLKELSPRPPAVRAAFRPAGAATAVTENNRRELFHPRRRAVSCEAALRILSNGEACPPCGGDSGMTMGGILLRLDWELLREHVLTTGVVRHACRRRRDGTRRFLFLRFVGGVVRFPEGCCRSGNAKQSFAGRIPKRSLGTTQV